jgi:hypothetical protein
MTNASSRVTASLMDDVTVLIQHLGRLMQMSVGPGGNPGRLSPAVA